MSDELRCKDSELQKESEVQSTRRDLEEARQRAEVAKATLESERAAFEEGKECLEDDLNQALTAKNVAETHVQTMTD